MENSQIYCMIYENAPARSHLRLRYVVHCYCCMCGRVIRLFLHAASESHPQGWYSIIQLFRILCIILIIQYSILSKIQYLMHYPVSD
jgi:hypothetical protein